LAAEAAISSGFFRSAPKATSMNTPDVQAILDSAVVA